jgi:hypothetical protein
LERVQMPREEAFDCRLVARAGTLDQVKGRFAVS